MDRAPQLAKSNGTSASLRNQDDVQEKIVDDR